MARVTLDGRDGYASSLPDVCACCGKPACTTQEKKFAWVPPWLPLLAALGMLPYLLAVWIFRKEMTVQVPFCSRHRGYFVWLILIALGSFLLLVALVPGCIVLAAAAEQKLGRGNPLSVALLGGSLLVFFGGMMGVAAWSWCTTIRPVRITDHSITLVNVHEELARQASEGGSRRWSSALRDLEDPRSEPASRRAGSRAAGVRMTCPHCEEAVQFAEHLRGFRLACPECRVPVEVPE